MSKFNSYKFLAFGLAIAMSTISPILSNHPVFAQWDSPSSDNSRRYYRSVIPEGTIIPIMYEESDKILVTPEETVPVTLIVAANIKNSQNRVLIPYGSEINGEIQPSGNGSRFVAQTLIIDGQEYDIDAVSQEVTRTEQIEEGTDTGSILKGAAIGAAAATVIAGITGDNAIATEEVLGGAGLGALAGWILGGNNSAELISINPNRDLDLTLRSDLVLR